MLWTVTRVTITEDRVMVEADNTVEADIEADRHFASGEGYRTNSHHATDIRPS